MEFKSFIVKNSETNTRLDIYISKLLPNISRSQISNLIKQNLIKVNNKNVKPGYSIKSDDLIDIKIPEQKIAKYNPEQIDLNILYNDEYIAVINKDSGIVVHPAPGHYSGTLVNAILYHFPEIKSVGQRCGIVHRLDQYTSGCIVIAKNDEAHLKLSNSFKNRNVSKTYLALVYGEMEQSSGIIKYNIGRHPIDRKKMAVLENKGRVCETRWFVYKKFYGFTLLKVKLMTGRTHQIRVHLSAIKHPVVGDPIYCSNSYFNKLNNDYFDFLKTINRQMLHAWHLGFKHPANDNDMLFEAPIPQDMKNVLDKLSYQAV